MAKTGSGTVTATVELSWHLRSSVLHERVDRAVGVPLVQVNAVTRHGALVEWDIFCQLASCRAGQGFVAALHNQ